MFEKASFTESLYISWELVIKAICFRTRLALDTLLYTIYWSFSVFFLSVPVLIHLRDNISHDTFWSWHIYLLIINCTFNCFWYKLYREHLFKKKIFTTKENIKVHDYMYMKEYFYSCDKETLFILLCLHVTHNPTRNEITFLYLYKLCVFIFLLHYFKQ